MNFLSPIPVDILCFPRFAGVVRHRSGVDTLLICDSDNNRVVEVSERCEFMRAIALPEGSRL